MASKMIGIPKNATIKALRAAITDASGGKKKFTDAEFVGTWDAMASGRADLAIGATGDAPSGAAYTARPLGQVEMVLVAAPWHPLAKAPGPVTEAMLLEHRAVSIADSSRLLPPRTAGLSSTAATG